jgi:hypothetical protein
MAKFKFREQFAGSAAGGLKAPSAEGFMFRENFPRLSAEALTAARAAVETLFYGVMTLWGTMPRDVAERKRALCYQYLTAWQLALWHPEEVVGVANNGGMPLQSKSIKNISLTFKSIARQDGALDELQANPFGIQALTMLQSAPENFMLAR